MPEGPDITEELETHGTPIASARHTPAAPADWIDLSIRKGENEGLRLEFTFLALGREAKTQQDQEPKYENGKRKQ